MVIQNDGRLWLTLCSLGHSILAASHRMILRNVLGCDTLGRFERHGVAQAQAELGDVTAWYGARIEACTERHWGVIS